MKSKAFWFFSYLFFVSALAVIVILTLTSLFDLHAVRAAEIAFILAFVCGMVGYVGLAVSGLYALFQRNDNYRYVAIFLGITGVIIELVLYKFEMEPMFLGYAFPFIVPVGLGLAIIGIAKGFRNKNRLDALSALAVVLNALPIVVVTYIASIASRI